MKKRNLLKLLMPVLLILSGLVTTSFAQVKYTIKDNVTLVINGTSTLHDWSMKSARGSGDATFAINASGRITGVSSLFFMTPVSELKSEHSGLDKNAYKSLKSDKNPYITYTANSGTVSSSDGVTYTVKTTGKLAIAGTSKETEVTFTLKLNADKSITVTGSKVISMKDWGVEPPSFMFGAMKTGKDITLKFDATIKK